eukprot:7903222-Pyramimonas_sp.AAC.1
MLASAPSMASWQHAFKTKDSAASPDGLASAVVKRSANLLAAAYHPLVVKSALRVRGPTQ